MYYNITLHKGLQSGGGKVSAVHQLYATDSSSSKASNECKLQKKIVCDKNTCHILNTLTFNVLTDKLYHCAAVVMVFNKKTPANS